MSADKKFVYSVTLNEPVADELRRFDMKGKLSRGITRAQELLSLPHVLEYALAVESNQTESFYARFYSGLYKTAVRPPAMPSEPPGQRPPPPIDADSARIEEAAFAKSQAAYDAGDPLPDHAALRGDLHRIRQRVLERCEAAFGWRHGPRPPGLIDPFGEIPLNTTPPATQPAIESSTQLSDEEQIEAGYQQWLAEQRQEPAGGSEGKGSDAAAIEPAPDEALPKTQSAQGPMDPGATAHAAPASTADVTEAGLPTSVADNPLQEPCF